MTTKKVTGSQAVILSLLEEGVDTIFGYPGGAIMPIYDALYDFDKHVTHILTRHEQGAVHAAEGFARVTGRAGVVFATSGPGATNLITGIADAMIDSTVSAFPAQEIESPTNTLSRINEPTNVASKCQHFQLMPGCFQNKKEGKGLCDCLPKRSYLMYKSPFQT